MFGVPDALHSEALPLNTDDLLKFGHDLNEIVLGTHDLLDVFIGTGDLVDDAFVLSALDSGGLLLGHRSRIRLRFGSGHLSSRTVRARVEALRISQTSDDERFRSHRAGDDPEAILFGVDRTLSGNVNLVAEMLLDRNIVVMAVDTSISCDLEFDSWSLNIRLNDRIRRFIMISRFFIA